MTRSPLFAQDDWRVGPSLTLNLRLRYELDTDVKNISRVDEIPLVQPFLQGTRHCDKNNLGPRVGFNWAPADGRTSVHGDYGISSRSPSRQCSCSKSARRGCT